MVSRGSNGVVIVTTKRGKAGQSSIDFESYYGVKTVRRTIPLLNARQYGDFINEAFVGMAVANLISTARPRTVRCGEFAKGLDWQKEGFSRHPFEVTS